MIRLDNVPDLGLYISGNHITVAKDNAVTLNFSETDTTCTATVTPSTVSIAGTLLNLTEVIVTSDLVCANPINDSSSTETYNYEVIDSKVIYQRIDKSTGLMFIDVSGVSTYNHLHNIPISNTTWIQNPQIVNGNLGGIVIEKYNDITNNWDVIGVAPIGGSFTYYSNIDKDDNITCRFRSRFEIRQRRNCGGTSPLLFQAQGDEFDVILKYYEEDNLYIKDIITSTEDKNKYNLCKAKDTSLDYLTVEVDKQIEVFYDSYNIDYVYNYLESSSSLEFEPIPALTYNQGNRSIVGRITDLEPRTPTKMVHVEFIGCQNRFIDGKLTINSVCGDGVPETAGDFNCNNYSDDFYKNCADVINPSIVVESKQLNIEGVRPNILHLIQEDCTYCLNITDNTIIENPCLRGKVLYQYKTSLNGDWCEFNPIKNILPLSSFTNCFCEAGTVYFRNKYKYEEVHTCSCHHKHDEAVEHDILFETDWYEYTTEVLEYKPKIEATIINEDNCCTTLDSTVDQYIDIVPNIIEINDFFCSDLVPRVLSTLTYTLELYNQDDSIWELIEEYKLNINIDDYDVTDPIITDPTILSNYQYRINKDILEQGGYRVRYVLENCCAEVEEVLFINLCDSLTIRRECDIFTPEEDFNECDCYNHVINNYSPTDTYIIEVFNTNLKTVVDTVTVLPNTELNYKFVEDGIYTLSIRNTKDIDAIGKYSNPYIVPVFVFCAVNKCYTNLVKDILCSYNADCDCENEDLVKDRFRLNKIMALYQTWMRLIEKDYYLMSRYNAIDIEKKLETFNRLNKVHEQLLNFCEPCNNGTKSNCCG